MKKPVAIILVVVVLLAAGIGGWLKPPMTMRRISITVSKAYGKAALFPPTTWKTRAHPATRRRQR